MPKVGKFELPLTRHTNQSFADQLGVGRIACHPLIVAEIALGSLKSRADILELLDSLPRVSDASYVEIRTFIEAQKLYAKGVGYVDVSLLASCLITPDTRLWTYDKRLAALAEELGILYSAPAN